ncbi:MAG: YgeY family selenium metabolism-linked hydrolase [Gemmatimonadetes bacterium]|nr:YgeY family selenium metabolism-linked hydrolase [Gemmatimonadota bacterium]NNM04204.1 YgeY family selenium metabolism-linked hydrolase [Gemmatimonadota bacterium]
MDKASLIRFAQELVQKPSLSCQEGDVARRAEGEMRALGYDEVHTDPFGNVVGVIEGTGEGPTLLLDAHTDTVDVKGAVPWGRDPFSGDVADGFLHGRGSADMKGALAAMIHGAASVDRDRLRGRVVMCASPMEEVLEGVALREVMEEYRPDFVVIGEATDLGIARGGRGRAEIHLEATGIPTHSSAPHLGRNAVLEMMKVVGQLEDVPLPVDPVMGPAILALTEMVSAPYPANSVIPSICRATYDRRLIPGETVEDVLEPIKVAARADGVELKAEVGIGEYTTFTGKTLRKEKFFPAWLFPEDDWFVERALAGLERRGLERKVGAYRFCTNAAYSAGEAGVPTVGFGPAKETDAHLVDERLSLTDLEAAAEGYAGIIESALATIDRT